MISWKFELNLIILCFREVEMKYQEKKETRKPKYEEKEKPPTKFNFVYDEYNVTFKT